MSPLSIDQDAALALALFKGSSQIWWVALADVATSLKQVAWSCGSKSSMLPGAQARLKSPKKEAFPSCTGAQAHAPRVLPNDERGLANGCGQNGRERQKQCGCKERKKLSG